MVKLEDIPRWLTAAAVAFWVASLSPGAAAQTDEARAGARAVATEGAKAYQEGRWQEAVDLFARAESIVHAPPHLLYMARAHEKLGHLVKAKELYNEILREVLPADAPEAFRSAQTAAAEEIKAVEPRLATLTILVTGAGHGAPAVTMDGKPVPPGLVGVPHPVDPGTHEVEATAEGWAASSATVSLTEGGSNTATLELTPLSGSPTPAAGDSAATPAAEAPAGAAAGSPADADAGTTASGGTNSLRIGSYVALGVGAVGLGAGTIFGLKSAGKRADGDDAVSECPQPCLKNDPAAKRASGLYDEARTAQTLAVVGFVVGGAGIAAGVAMFLLSGDEPEQATAAAGPTVRPWVGVGSAGLWGTF